MRPKHVGKLLLIAVLWATPQVKSKSRLFNYLDCIAALSHLPPSPADQASLTERIMDDDFNTSSTWQDYTHLMPWIVALIGSGDSDFSWLDAGAGEGIAIRQYYKYDSLIDPYSGEIYDNSIKVKVTGVTAGKRSLMPDRKRNKLERKYGLKYHSGKMIEDLYLQGQIAPADLITTYQGVLSFTFDIKMMLELLLSNLNPNGHLSGVLDGRTRFFGQNNKEVSWCAMATKIQGIEVIHCNWFTSDRNDFFSEGWRFLFQRTDSAPIVVPMDGPAFASNGTRDFRLTY